MIAYADWKKKRIPDILIMLLLIAGCIETCMYTEVTAGQRVTGFFLISVPLLFLTCVVPGSIGGGDIKLMAVAGLLLGASKVWEAFVAGMIMAAAVCVILLTANKAGRKTEIALGPFLVIGIAWEFLRY